MKTRFFLGLAFIAIGLLAMSCNKEEDVVEDGKIGLQQTKFFFQYNLEENFSTSTEGENWYFSSVTLGDKKYSLSKKGQGTVFEKTVDWLTFKRNGKEISGTVADMPEEEAFEGTRTFRIVLRSGTTEEVITGEQGMYEGPREDMIGLSQKEVTFPKAGGSVDIKTEKGMAWWFESITIGQEVLRMGMEKNSFSNDWLSFEKTADGVHISVKENTTGADRTFVIGLQSGDFFATIKCVQLGK